MKKLMIAAAIVCAAALSHGASVQWTSAAIKGVSEANFAAGLVDGKSYNADGKAVVNSAYTAYGSGTLAYTLTLTYDLGSGATSDVLTGTLAKNNGLTTLGKIQSTVTSAIFDSAYLTTLGKIQSTVTSAIFDSAYAGYDYSYTLVLTDTGTDGKDQKFTVTATIEGASKVPTGTISFATDVPATWVASVESVPEPTSGLLLLLGVAGLALRRRRA